MKRDFIRKLEKSDDAGKIRTFIIYGMKGVGKTGAIIEYAENKYEEHIYIDASLYSDFLKFCKENTALGEDRLTDTLSDYLNINPEYLVNIPIIIDEPCKSIIETGIFENGGGFLKLFIISSDEQTGLYLEKCFENAEMIKVLPLNYGEFLTDLDKEWYTEIIEGHLMSRKKIPDMIHDELTDIFDQFMITGGMPEIVEEFKRLQITDNLEQKQRLLKYGILYDGMYEAECESRTKVKALWDAIENTLEKDNHKFMYSSIRDGATRKIYENEMSFLSSRNMLLKVEKLQEKQDNTGDFRLYYSDISLYERHETGKSLESLLVQEISGGGTLIRYWESGKGTAVDMVLEFDGKNIPVELKAYGRGNSRSVNAYLKARPEKKILRLSRDNCKFEGDMVSIPLYASYAINRINSIF